MKRRLALLLIDIIVLSALIVGGALPAAPVRAEEPQEPALAGDDPGSSASAVPEEGDSPPLEPAGLGPTLADDPPFKAPVKLDLEMMLGPHYNTATFGVNQTATWHPAVRSVGPDGQPGPRTKSEITAVAAGSERLMAVWHERSIDALRARVWWPGQGDYVETDLKIMDEDQPDVETKPAGNPHLVSLTPERAFLLNRDADGYLHFRQWDDSLDDPWGGTWQELPGKYQLATDSVAVSKDSTHIALFMRDTISATVKFTEWRPDVGWRSQPVNLGNPPGTTIASPLAALSRHDRQIAVFGVGQNGSLYYREWTSQNRSDWGDTEWKKLMDGVATDGRISVASRHNNHMVVAVWQSGGTAAYREWLGKAGWDVPRDIGNPGSQWAHGVQTPAIAVTGINSMVFLMPADGQLWHMDCQPQGKCDPWRAPSDSHTWLDRQSVVPVSRWPHDLTVLGREANDDNSLLSKQNTAEFAQPTPVVERNHFYAEVGGQVIATVQGKTIWAGASPMPGQICQLAVADTSHWSVSGWTSLEGQYCFGPRTFAVDAGDLDGDGDDEVLVSSLIAETLFTSVVDIGYGGPPGSPVLTPVAGQAVKTWLGSAVDPQQIAVAAGDLDGDGQRNQVVVGYNTSPDPDSPGTIGMVVYQYQEGHGLQQQGSPQSFSPWVNGDDTAASVWDFEIATVGATIGDGDHVVLAVETATHPDKRYYISFDEYLYDWAKDQRGDRSLVLVERQHHFPVETRRNADPPFGPYSIDLATGDLDGDGVEEVVFAHPYRLYTSAGQHCLDCLPGDSASNVQLLATGDIDGDAKAEILRITEPSSVANLQIIEYAQEPHQIQDPYSKHVFTNTHLYVTGQLQAFRGVPLVADLDGNSMQAERVKCDTYDDVNVTAVLNGVPRYYEGDDPQQENGGGYGTGNTNQTGAEDGISGYVGTSVGFGGSKGEEGIAKVTVMGELETQRRFGTSSKVVESTTTERGEKLVDSKGRGLVVYTSSSYKCCQYDTYYPSAPDDRSTMLTCTPAHAQPQTSHTLEDWHSADFKTDAGASWVDVGRASAPAEYRGTNDVSTYPSRLTVDPYLVKWNDPGAETHVQWSTDPEANPHTWGLEQSHEEEQVKKGGTESRLTVSVAAEIGHLELEWSVFGGVETDWSYSTSWEKTLSFEGEVYDYPKLCYDNGVCKDSYNVQPFLWQATARTQAGVTYPYLELDYYVPSKEGTMAAVATDVAHDAAAGPAPLEPAIASLTHPDPDAWYTGRDVTFDWGQPAGDPAQVTGYRWNLNDEADFEPTALHRVMTDTMAFVGVPDGLHYLHLQARSEGGDGPIAHRALRIDADPPQIEIRLQPLAPDGLNGWYRTPVEATLAFTDGLGSGVATVEVSTDGATWQPHMAPLAFNTPTAGTTLWARATDQAGHTSEPVQATFRIDLAAPTSADSDGVGLSYHNVSTDEMGNAQLVLGGTSEDTLAGRFMVEVKGGDTGSWRPVQTVGEFPMPPDNELTSTMDTIRWVYTPTQEIRGIYPLRGRSIDAAGNVEAEWAFGTFWWEPDGAPDLSQTRVSVKPRQAFPGDTVRFTLGLRNSGVQESQVAVVDRLPAELAPLPESISSGGRYDAGDGSIRWTLHDLWPGQTRYLTFDARVNPGLAPSEPVALENRLEVMGYWPWEPGAGGPPPPPSYPYSTSTTLTVLPGAMAQVAAAQAAAHPPAIYTAKVLEGAVVDRPLASLYVHASPDTEFLYVKEWVWDHGAGDWALANDSGWLPFTPGDNLEVAADATGKHGQLRWQLSGGDGVKYLGVWVANGDKHTTNLNEGHLVFTNLVSASGQRLGAGQRVQYRLPMHSGQLGLFALSTESGDADLYGWQPRFAFRPHYVSNASGSDHHVEGFGFNAEEYGVYVIEVEAAGQDSVYRLLVGGDVPGAASLASVGAALGVPDEAGIRASLPGGIQEPMAKKKRPEHPLTLSSPLGLPDAEVLDDVPRPSPTIRGYLPLVHRDR